MTLRARMLLAFAVVVLIPLALLALGLRQEMTRRFYDEYQLRVDAAVGVIYEDLERESSNIAQRLTSLKNALLSDNRFRLAAVAGMDSERQYLLEYAGNAMALTGLSMLQVLDEEERIISSGHFRNEHGRRVPGLTTALAQGHDVTLMTTRSAERDFLSLVRAESFRLAGRTFILVGGIAVDDLFLKRLARGPETLVSLQYSGGVFTSDPSGSHGEGVVVPADAAIAFRDIPIIHTQTEGPLARESARLQVTQERTPLRALLRSVDMWFLATAIAAAIGALLLAFRLSDDISRPLANLARRASFYDLNSSVSFDVGPGEVGTLARVLNELVSRLRKSVLLTREAERRAAVGELARQVNHDIKNGLIPIRNVMRHLERVQRDDPSALPSVFAERRNTIDSSLAYLETLARNYQQLSPAIKRQPCRLDGLITEIMRTMVGNGHTRYSTELPPKLPEVFGDPVAFHRILQNLVTNATESLEGRPGRVVISAQVVEQNGSAPKVRLTVSDTGKGMSKDEMGKIFNDFYTTKEGGTGLGLSIVRRLVMDAGGTIAVESETGKGTRMIVDFPVHQEGQ